MKKWHFGTLAVHGEGKEGALGAVATPVYLATTYAQPALGSFQDYVYTRGSNPGRLELEKRLALLENARRAFAFSSGMAGTTAAFHLFKPGDLILLNNNVYGGTFRYASRLFPAQGLSYRLIDDFNTLDFDAVPPNTRGVFVETPSNPLLRVTDLRRLAEGAHKRGILVIVDNTFMTARLQRPLELGADIVVYSATKYYGGHSDILAGVVAVNSEELAEQVALLQNTLGSPLAPADSYLLERSLKTLALRIERQEQNAAAAAAFLQGHPKVKRLYYPTVNDEEARIQASQAAGNGAVLSFTLREGRDPAKFIAALRLFAFAVSLGSVESLVCHPASQTHESFSRELREAAGIEEGLLRLSIGIEDAADILEDLRRGLDAA